MFLKLIDLSEIKVDHTQNPRKEVDKKTIEELQKSIVAVREMSGTQKVLLQPLTVRELSKPEGKLKYELRLGYRRYAALEGLVAQNPDKYNWASKPEVLVNDHDPDDEVDHATVAFALIENVQREDMSAIDEATAISSLLKDHGLKQKDIVTLLGKSKGWVSQRLKLLTTAALVQEALGDGTIGAAAGRQLSRLDSKKHQKDLLEHGVSEGWGEEDWKRGVDQMLSGDLDLKKGKPKQEKEKLEAPSAPGAEGTFTDAEWTYQRKPEAVKEISEDLEYDDSFASEVNTYRQGALDALLWVMGLRDDPPNKVD